MTSENKAHAELEQVLAAQEADLQDIIRRMRDEVAAPGGAGGGWPEVKDSVEDGDARMMATLDLNQLHRAEQELGEVAQARQRMRDGSYGYCEDCGEEIPIERLRVLPAARYCVTHEAQHEQRHERGATP